MTDKKESVGEMEPVRTGRSTICTPELVQKAKDYLRDWKKLGDKIPSIEALACELKIHRDTIHYWKSSNYDDIRAVFSDIVSDILAEQARTLHNNGLSGDYNASITKLILSKHGYTEKKEVEVKRVLTEIELDNRLRELGHEP
jgi:hypothetical protein